MARLSLGPRCGGQGDVFRKEADRNWPFSGVSLADSAFAREEGGIVLLETSFSQEPQSGSFLKVGGALPPGRLAEKTSF